jgi:hypothetical protein
MIPIVTKAEEVIWYNVKFVNKNTINNIANDLHKEFNGLYNKMRLHIDVYNFILFGYENTKCLLIEQTESYDTQYELNIDIKSKCLEYKVELNKTLDCIHNLFNELNELLSIKHLK